VCAFGGGGGEIVLKFLASEMQGTGAEARIQAEEVLDAEGECFLRCWRGALLGSWLEAEASK
jgi:hypothetical protein